LEITLRVQGLLGLMGHHFGAGYRPSSGTQKFFGDLLHLGSGIASPTA